MATLTLRIDKGSPLTNNELDNNFRQLNLTKIEVGGDIGGSTSAPSVISLRGYALSSSAPTTGQALVWSGSAWAASSITTGGGSGLPATTTAVGTVYGLTEDNSGVDTQNTALGYGITVGTSLAYNNVVVGAFANSGIYNLTVLVGNSALAGADEGVAVGAGSYAQGVGGTAIGRAAAANSYAVAIGYGAEANLGNDGAPPDIAIGYSSFAWSTGQSGSTNYSNIVIGPNSTANGDNRILIGKNITSTAGSGNGTIALLASGTARTIPNDGVFIDSIRSSGSGSPNYILQYNSSTKEVFYGTSGTVGGAVYITNTISSTVSSTVTSTVTNTLTPTITSTTTTYPAFSAYPSSSVTQTISSGSQQKVLFQNEEFDINSNFANSRFTPTVAGYYQLNAVARISGTMGTGESMLVIWKNGAEYKRGWNQSGTEVGANFLAMQVSALVYANGTGDFFEIYIQQGSGSNRDITVAHNPGYGNITWFNGTYVPTQIITAVSGISTSVSTVTNTSISTITSVVTTSAIAGGSIVTVLTDITNLFNNKTQSFPLKVDGGSSIAIGVHYGDNKDFTVFIGNRNYRPAVPQVSTLGPWIVDYTAQPSYTFKVTGSTITFYRAIEFRQAADIRINTLSASRQRRPRYPFSANSIVLGD